MNQGIEGLGQKVSLSARVVTLITCMLSMNEAATRGVLLKKVFLKIAQNSQENTCARVSFLRLWHRYLSCEFCAIFKNTFYPKHLWTTASTLNFLNHLFIRFSGQPYLKKISLRISNSVYNLAQTEHIRKYL